MGAILFLAFQTPLPESDGILKGMTETPHGKVKKFHLPHLPVVGELSLF